MDCYALVAVIGPCVILRSSRCHISKTKHDRPVVNLHKPIRKLTLLILLLLSDPLQDAPLWHSNLPLHGKA